MHGSPAIARGVVVVALVATFVIAAATPAWAATPPGRQTDGYGSTAGYVSAGAARFEAGSAGDGSKVWWWVPSTLRDGASPPSWCTSTASRSPTPSPTSPTSTT